MADNAANKGAAPEQRDNNWTFQTAKAVINRAIRKKKTIVHERLRRVYGEGYKIKSDRELTRTQQVNISRIRSGHHQDFLSWRKKFNLLSDDIEEDTCQERKGKERGHNRNKIFLLGNQCDYYLF